MTEVTSESDSFLVRYQNDTFDLKRFLHKHPGGIGTLAALRNRDLTQIMSKDPVHSEAAFYLMKEYKLPKDSDNNNSYMKVDHRAESDKKQSLLHYVTSTTGHQPAKNATHPGLRGDKEFRSSDKADTRPPVLKAESHSHGVVCEDGRLEHLVDWDKAMLPQIAALGDKYHEWVNSPVDRQLRLFAPWYLECLTKTPWWLVPLVWLPCIAYLVLNEILYNQSLHTELLPSLLKSYFGGILMWTAVEYILHRYVFHMDTKELGDFGRLFHFLLHGLHHKVPTDPYRLVFPPVPALIIATTIYHMCSYLFNYPRLVLAGGLSGYLIYDMIHYYLHYGSPTQKDAFNKYLYHIKRYHYQHHYVHHDKGFGISSPLWDYVFNTDIILRKLKVTLRW